MFFLFVINLFLSPMQHRRVKTSAVRRAGIGHGLVGVHAGDHAAVHKDLHLIAHRDGSNFLRIADLIVNLFLIGIGLDNADGSGADLHNSAKFLILAHSHPVERVRLLRSAAYISMGLTRSG